MTAILPNHPFCRFCSQIEQQAGAAIQSLHSRYELNTTLLLFCYWFAVNQYGLLSKTQIKHVLAALYAWHQRIVSPLEYLCNQLNNSEVGSWLQSLSEDALDTKHTAEHIEQLLIIEILPKKSRRNRPTLAQAAIHACMNVGSYCQSIYANLDEMDYVHLGEILTAVFPDLEAHKAATLCRNTLSERQPKEPVQRPLPLDVRG